QLQLDVYGEVIEAVTHFVHRGGKLDRETQQMLRHFGSYVCRHWRQPDNGIWEPHGKRKHFTHSRLLCWVALVRLLHLHQQGLISGLPVDTLRPHRDETRADILQNAWNDRLQSYTQSLGDSTLDAAALLLALHHFEDAASPRMQGTCARLREPLEAGPGLMYRYEKSFEGREGTFAMCAFWLVEFLARGGGTLDEAHQAMEETLSYANELGPFAQAMH